jgi:predicted DNA-binding transcriptional regulator AlpA
MMRKYDMQRPYRPEFMTLSTLAYMLDLGERTVRDYVSDGFLPQPVMIGNVKRWRWGDVELYLDNSEHQSEGALPQGVENDEYSQGVKRATQKETDGGATQGGLPSKSPRP